MPYRDAGGPRDLLKRLNRTLAEPGESQERLDKITRLIANSMVAEVCSIYLRRGAEALELFASEGLKSEAVHQTVMSFGQGLVGRIARDAEPINTADAPNTPGFEYRPETGEEIYQSFVGVPIQRLGRVIGVLVVQNQAARRYEQEDVDALEVVAMVIAEMVSAGALIARETLDAQARGPHFIHGVAAGDGLAIGPAHLHEPRIVVANPISENIEAERARLTAAMDAMRTEVDGLVKTDLLGASGEHRDVLEAWRMFAYDKGWMRKLDEAVGSGLAAEVAVEKVQSEARARMDRVADPYIRERLHDLDDLANRLIRRLLGVGVGDDAVPEKAILIARNIGPGELLDYGGKVRGVVLEEGSSSSHAAIVARALAIPLVVQATGVAEVEPGDEVVVDGDVGTVHLRPDETVKAAFFEKLAFKAEEQKVYETLRDKPAETLDGVRISLTMNAGLLADLPSLDQSGAEGVGLYRTELQFLIRTRLPGRDSQAAFFSRVLDAAAGKPIVFRTLDIGSDKIVPYLPRAEQEENPAMGWRAIRVGLDRPNILKMQVQSLLRGAAGRPISIMFPMITEMGEFTEARNIVLHEQDRMVASGRETPSDLRIGAMFETPALAFAPDSFYETADFISVGGNDLHQFFFAADRSNERVRRRYDGLCLAWLDFLAEIVRRCDKAGTPISYCGEAAGRPIEALALAAIGYRSLSMRPSSIGPVKRMLRSVDLTEVRSLIQTARAHGAASIRPALAAWLKDINTPQE